MHKSRKKVPLKSRHRLVSALVALAFVAIITCGLAQSQQVELTKQVGDGPAESYGADPCLLTALHAPTFVPALSPSRLLWVLQQPNVRFPLEITSLPHHVRPPPLAL